MGALKQGRARIFFRKRIRVKKKEGEGGGASIARDRRQAVSGGKEQRS